MGGIARRRTLRRRRPARRRRIGLNVPRARDPVGRRDGEARKSERRRRGIVRAMARPGTAAADSGAGRTHLTDGTAIRSLQIVPPPQVWPLHLVVRETELCGLRLAGDFRRRTPGNGRNSVRRPRITSLTDQNCEGFCVPGNRVGLPGLHGGGCRDRTCGPSRVKGVFYR